MSSLSLMVHSCRISRNTPANDEGVIVAAWTDVATDVPCLMQEKSGAVKRGEAGAGLEYDAVIYLPPDTDIRPQGAGDQPDRVAITSPARLADRVFLVKFVSDDSGMGDHLKAFVQRLSKG